MVDGVKSNLTEGVKGCTLVWYYNAHNGSQNSHMER